MKKQSFLIIVLLIICSTLVCAVNSNNDLIKFDEETIYQDSTTFKWCFKPGWEDQPLLKDYLEVYIDNWGCDITERNLYAVTPVIQQIEVCEPIQYKCTDYFIPDPKNGTKQITECTELPRACKQVEQVYEEKYDLEQTDYFFPKNSKICYEAKRKFKLEPQLCDMNFRFDLNNDGGYEIDAVDYDKLFWNSTNWLVTATPNTTFITTPTDSGQILYLKGCNCSNDPTNLTCTDSMKNNASCYNNFCNNLMGASSDCSDIEVFDSSSNTTVPFIALVNITGASWIGNQTGTSDSLLWDAIYIPAPLWNQSINLSSNIRISTNGTSTNDLNNDSSIGYVNMSWIFEPALDDLQLKDWSGNGYDMTEGGNPTFVINGSTAERRSGGQQGYYRFDANTEYLYSISVKDDVFTSGCWVKPDRLPSWGMIISTMHSGNNGWGLGHWSNASLLFWDGGFRYVDDTLTANVWQHLVIKKNTTSAYAYLDGVNVGNFGNNAINHAAVVNFHLGRTYDDAASDSFFGGVDDCFYDPVAWTDEQILNEYDKPRHIDGWWVSEGGELSTNVDTGIYDENYVDLNNSVDESQEFFIWANFSYVINSSTIHPNGFCNYTADEVIDESYNQTIGLNTTVCGAGCDFINKTVILTDFDTDGFINDFIRTTVCHNGVTRRDFYISNNCTGSHIGIDRFDFPLCSGGFSNITINTTNCSGQSDILLGIWSDGANSAQALRLVDDLLGIDRLHNHTDDLLFNDTLQRYVSEEEHEYYVHGIHNITVDCFANISGITNSSDNTLSITVVNVPPIVTIDTIWWWLLDDTPVSFSPGVIARYPLVSTINISTIVVDDDLSNVTYYLNYTSNNTNIFSFVDSEILSLNFTQNNFSTETNYLDGSLSYTYQVIAVDDSANTTVASRTFTARNDVPVAAWNNASPLIIGSAPVNISWNCTDTEEESMTSYVFINGTLNTSTVFDWFNFNQSVGTWNVTVSCEDSFFNSTNETLIIQYSQECIIDFINPCDGCRYSDNIISADINCSNSVSIDSCWFSINDFANITIDNCPGSFNITGELGWNKYTVSVESGGLVTSEDVNFWAKKQNTSILNYPVILFTLLILLIFIYLASKFKIGVLYLIAGIIGIVLGYELVSISMVLGVITGILLFLSGIVLTLKD